MNTETYQEFTLARTNEKDLKFVGRSLGFVYDAENSISSQIFITTNGAYVCCKWQSQNGDTDNIVWQECEICKTHEEVVDFFGQSEDANCLYERANINNVNKED